MELKPGASGGATAVKNCASIKDGPQDVCVTMPLTDGPLLRAHKFTAAQTCQPTCTFAIAIVNVGAADAPGPITFNDVFTPAASGVTITQTDGDFTCSKANGQFQCTTAADKVLKPGDAAHVTITMSGIAHAPQYQNCVQINGTTPVDNDAPSRCVTIVDNTPAPVEVQPAPEPGLNDVPNIAVSMRALSDICAIHGADYATKATQRGNCKFEATFTNTGGAPFDGDLRFTNTVSGGGLPAWHDNDHCTRQGNSLTVDCRIVDSRAAAQPEVVLPPHGGAVSTIVDIEPGDNWHKGDVLTSCTSFSYSSVSKIMDPGTITSDDTACASIKLDPFNVKVAKSGDQTCQPGADCHFSLTLYNPGPIDHDAPVTISDKLNVGSAPIVSISPPLPCASQPTQVPFTCTSPGNFPLPLGGPPHVYNLTIRLPAGATSYTNCATVGPLPNGDANQELGNSIANTSCVTTAMQPPPVSKIDVVKTGDQTCTPGTDCHFTLTLSNPGPVDHDAPLTISDKLSTGTAPITSISPPLPCAAQPTQVPFTCTSPGNFSLPLGGPPQVYNLTVHLPAGASSYTNCATVGPLPNGEANQELGDTISSTSCVTTAMPPPPAPRLEVTKTGDATCEPGGPCHFHIEISNTGTAPLDDAVDFIDSLDAGSAQIVSMSPALCRNKVDALPVNCETNPLSLQPGAAMGVDMTVIMPNSAVTEMTNCVTIRLPHDEHRPSACFTVLSNAVSNAMSGFGIHLPLEPPTTPGNGTGDTYPIQSQSPAPLAAPHLKISKTGPASCIAGQTCLFTISITNDGTAPFNGRATLSDTLDIGTAQIVGVGAQFCQAMPTQVPFTGCATSPITLAPGAVTGFSMALMLPQTSATSATNCASVAIAPLGLIVGAVVGLPQPETSCATVALQPFVGTGGASGVLSQTPPTQPPANAAPQPSPSAGPSACFSNMVPDGRGGCGCPADSFWDGTQCQSGGGANGVLTPDAASAHQTPLLKCPTGTTGTYPNCQAIPVKRTQVLQKCPRGFVGSPPTCSCPTGTHVSRSGRSCLPDAKNAAQGQRFSCPPNATGGYPACRCPSGSYFDQATDSCVPLNAPSGPFGNGGPFPNLPGFQMGGPNFQMGFGGRHPRGPNGGGKNGVQEQTMPQTAVCPAGQVYATQVRKCVPGGGGTVTPKPATPSTPDYTDFGGCPGCSKGGGFVPPK